MARRVNSELLLVGSLPAGSTDSALRQAAEFFGGLVFAPPDGETGPRAGWVSYERERLVRPNPGVVTLQETESPTGLPRHAYETPVFGIRPGVTELRSRLPGRRARLRGPGGTRIATAHRGDPAGGPGYPVGHGLRDPGPRGSPRVDR